MIKVAAYTGGKNVPSARYRIRQLVPHLKENDINVKEFYSSITAYPPTQKLLRPLWGLAGLASRVPSIIAGYGTDITILQRELISTLVTLESCTKKPRVLDVDDAIFLHRQGKPAQKLAGMCDHIICGNDFLAEKFGQWNSSISILPTAVDTDLYRPTKLTKEKKVIGWIGTRGNFKYLYQIADPLEKVLLNRNDLVFRVISDQRPVFNNKLDSLLDFVPWSAADEVDQLQGMTVGIMPLFDGEWERGKCSFKMLQYMACGIPVVVSPVGMNKQVLSMAESGFAANTQNEWIEALNTLLDDESICRQYGARGRDVVKKNFSHVIIAKQLADILKKVA